MTLTPAPFTPDTAAIRFGTGLSPQLSAPQSVAAMLSDLSGPDTIGDRFPVPVFEDLIPTLTEIGRLQRIKRRQKGTEAAKSANKSIRKLKQKARSDQAEWLSQAVARSVFTSDGFRERLARFWADHFTVEGKAGVLRGAASTYVEEAIRPNLTGAFARLMTAAVTHPMMLIYLDQYNSAGPGSPLARRKGRGINENLAREVLELHSLGVDGGYTQRDVSELAELLTGMSFNRLDGFVFRPDMAEPGAETVLGRSYGGAVPDMEDIRRFLSDLSLQPQTARHIAWKLARHFVSDTPDPTLVRSMAASFLASGGDLMALYSAMLSNPRSWAGADQKIKQPFGFVTSALRAIGMEDRRLTALKPKEIGLYLALPLRTMGQAWEDPTGPDGWPEEGAAWITPQGVAGRIQWAMAVPRVLRPKLPDPRALVDVALGDRAGEDIRFAAQGAETKWEGVGLVLSSPAFQRR